MESPVVPVLLKRSRSLEELPCWYQQEEWSSDKVQRAHAGSVLSLEHKDSGVACTSCSEAPGVLQLVPVQPKETTIGQHYYPEGGWGVVVVVCATLVHALTHGLHQAAGVTGLEMQRAFKPKLSVLEVGKANF
ncbi:hypothetical protein B566_EDAN012586 [Ephemera danica]|nr:hypothetical protein B566_EDAN012586 [Ephemera danica]